MFDPDYEQLPYEEEQLTFQKVANVTAFTLRHTESYKSPTALKPHENFPQSYDISLDKDIYANNALLIKQAIVDYLKNCLSAKFNTDQVFQQNHVFCFESSVERQGEEENYLESLIYGNRLLNETQKKDLLKNFEEFEELSGLIIELNESMGKLVTQEIVYVLASLFQAKMKAFLQLIKKNDDGILPKIGCFWGQENEEEFFKGSWEVYEDIDYDQVKKFASEGVEEQAMKLYFSGNLRYLNLREVKCEIKEGVSVADKFATLIIHLSRNIFLNLSGIAQHPEEAEEISNELSLDLFEDGLSERLSKRIKTDE